MNLIWLPKHQNTKQNKTKTPHHTANISLVPFDLDNALLFMLLHLHFQHVHTLTIHFIRMVHFHALI